MLLNLILNVIHFTSHRGLSGKRCCLVTHVTDGAENCRVTSLFAVKRKRRKLLLMTNASYYSQQHRPSLCGYRLGTQLLPVQPRRADGTQIRQQEFRAQGISERKIRHCFHYDIWYSYEFWMRFIKQASFSQAIQLSAGNQQKDIKKLKHTPYEHQKSYWVIFLRNKFNLTIDGCSRTKNTISKTFYKGWKKTFWQC